MTGESGSIHRSSQPRQEFRKGDEGAAPVRCSPMGESSGVEAPGVPRAPESAPKGREGRRARQGAGWVLAVTVALLLYSGCGNDDPGGSPVERGQKLMMRLGCRGCHVVEGAGGGKGPDLTHLVALLNNRLNSDEILKEIEDRKTYDPDWYARYRPIYDKVLAQQGDERIRAWLHVHLQDPKFNKPGTVMTPYGFLSESEQKDLIEYLMTQR